MANGILDKVKKAINKAFAFMEFPLSMSRQGDFPLDKSSLWWDLEEAKNYAKNNAIAYPGQPLTVVDEANNKVEFYIIGVDGELVGMGGMSDVTALKDALDAHKVDYEALKTAYEDTKAAVAKLREEFDAHNHTADEIDETATRIFMTPEQKDKLDAITYAVEADIDGLFPELHPGA